jgi:hypothetical protein
MKSVMADNSVYGRAGYERYYNTARSHGKFDELRSDSSAKMS